MPQEGWVALGTIIGFLLLGIATATREYFKTETKAVPPSPTTQAFISAVGMGWADREQIERHLEALESIALSLRAIADNRQTKLSEKMDDLIDRLKREA